MIWLWIGFGVSAAILIAAFFMGDAGFVLALIFGIAAFMCGLSLLIIGLSRHYGRISCHTFSQQTGRQTKFVLYNTFSTGDCLTPSGSGTWIPTSNLREFGGKP